MTLAALSAAERKKFGLGVDELARRIGASEADVRELEAGAEAAESWGAALAEIAVALGVPMSRFVAETGRAADYQAGSCGRLTRSRREERGLSIDQLAASSGVSREMLSALESGTSPAERWLPILLGVAQALDQPLFNFFYPYGVPLRELDAYA